MIAKDEIPPGTGIMAIPNRLLITAAKVRGIPDLSKAIKSQPGLFNESKKGEFNLLVLFLLHEKNKGEKSFFFPFFHELMLTEPQLTDEDVALADPLKENLWIRLQEKKKARREMMAGFAKIFPGLSSQVFDWVYQTVEAKAFSCCGTLVLAPGTHLLKHHPNEARAIGTFLINLDFENPLKKGIFPWGYKEVKGKANLLELFPGEKHLVGKEKKEPEGKARNALTLEGFWDFEISSDEGESWSDGGESDDEEEEDEESSGEELDEDEKRQEEEKLKEEFIKSFPGMKPEDIKAKGLEDYFKNSVTKCEKKALKKLSREKLEESKGTEEKSGWYKPTDDQVYFVITSGDAPIEKAGRVTFCTGRWENSFLLLKYGEVIRDNRFDAVVFRMWNGALKNKDKPNFVKEMLITRVISKGDKEAGTMMAGTARYPMRELSDEFTLKSAHFSDGTAKFCSPD